jgi:hypothetical protein
MQVAFDLDDFSTDTLMPQHNPFSKEFQEMRESYRHMARVVLGIEQDVGDLKRKPEKPSIWSKLWKERGWAIPTAVVLIGSIGTGAWYTGGLIVDKHIQASIKPLAEDLRKVANETARIGGIVSVLQAQIAAQKYSASEPTDLKNHRDELNQMKNNLSGVKKDTPNFWPASFEIIELLSKATSEISNPGKEGILDNVTGPGFEFRRGNGYLLKNQIANLVFYENVIRFDPSVRLINVTFINCVFIFPSVQPPPVPLQEITSALLAADLSHAVIKNAS